MRKYLLILLCGLALSSCSEEKQSNVVRGDFPVKPDEALVTELATMAHNIITQTFDPSVLPPDTVIEKVEVSIDRAEQELAARQGVISAYAAWCGLDWQEKSFMPMIANESYKRRFKGAQMDYFAMIHTLSFQKYSEQLAKQGACTEKDKAMVAPHLYDTPLGDVPDIPSDG